MLCLTSMFLKPTNAVSAEIRSCSFTTLRGSLDDLHRPVSILMTQFDCLTGTRIRWHAWVAYRNSELPDGQALAGGEGQWRAVLRMNDNNHVCDGGSCLGWDIFGMEVGLVGVI